MPIHSSAQGSSAIKCAQSMRHIDFLKVLSNNSWVRRWGRREIGARCRSRNKMENSGKRRLLYYGKQRLLYQGIAEWNSLDKSIRDMRSLLIFKQALKTAIF